MINVVTVNSGWILQKIAERIVAAKPDKFFLNHYYIPNSDNFYIDVQNCYHGHTGPQSIDIGLFTHVHENDIRNLAPHWFTLDGVIHMSRRNMLMWMQDNRHNPSTLITYKLVGEPTKAFSNCFKKQTIGIAQRGKYEGKGFQFMKELAEYNSASRFNWYFLGNDWDEVVDKLRSSTDVIYKQDKEASWPSSYVDFYRSIDYLLIPSKWEGGPMSLIEAAATGVQIIGAEVGWVGEEIDVFMSFPPGDIRQLDKILCRLTDAKWRAKETVEELSYSSYADFVIDCFEEIREKKNAQKNNSCSSNAP